LISTSPDDELEAVDEYESSTLDEDDDDNEEEEEQEEEINGIFDSRGRRLVVTLRFESRTGA
jgi:hypothetical protein